MAVTIAKIKRVFRYEGTELPDPAPGSKPDKCLELLAVSYPALNNAALDGPSFEGGKEIWQVKVEAGKKG